MITVENLALQYGSQVLFSGADLQFTAGNCYGIIGANGAGKSTFLKLLSGQEEPTKGHIYIDPKCRMSVLRQDQNMFDDHIVLETVIMGNPRLYECGKEKDAIYDKRSWRRNTQSWAAGRRIPTRPGFCRAWASPWRCTKSRWPSWKAAKK